MIKGNGSLHRFCRVAQLVGDGASFPLKVSLTAKWVLFPSSLTPPPEEITLTLLITVGKVKPLAKCHAKR